MQLLRRHGARIGVTFIPLLLAVLHVVGVLPMTVLQRLDEIFYDTRLRLTMPQTLDERIVIVDIDEKSLADEGRWPWPRDRVARLVDVLFEQQGIALLGFDTVFAEPDESSGLQQLQRLAEGPLAQQPGFAQQVEALRSELDRDARLAAALRDRPAVLGYYFTSDRGGRTSGVLPTPVMDAAALQGRRALFTQWDGYGANIGPLTAAAGSAGFFNAITDADGVVRSMPLLADYQGRYYESLALAMFRQLLQWPAVMPGFPPERFLSSDYLALKSVRLVKNGRHLDIPVDQRVAALVPFRGSGGPEGGSYRYVSATDLLNGRLAPGELRGRIVLLGTTAPGLMDLRVTPVGEAYPGVETHANLLSALLDGELKVRPDYATGFELVQLLLVGVLLAVVLPLLSAARAAWLSVAVLLVLVALNTLFYTASGLVLPLATTLVMAAFAVALNMSYGYLIETRAKRELAQLFGTYVPPELVDEMVKNPDSYSMAASTREMTVMFCDMRGFTQIAEGMDPLRLQALLNGVFSRLSQVIRAHQGTIDKYMGDCVMAFWGAPVDMPDHARRATEAALDMLRAIDDINARHAQAGLPRIGVGVGLNTGAMCVGDMGSDLRRSYTVIGDAVNLAARLESLSREYGVAIVASEATQAQVQDLCWQPIDFVRVKGKALAVNIWTPLCVADAVTPALREELRLWSDFQQAWRARDWIACETVLERLQRMNEKKVLYRVWADRVASARISPPDTDWDGITTFVSK